MINRIQTSNPSFGAKLLTYPHTVTNKDIFKAFEEKTKEFPELILKQSDISYLGKDYFMIIPENHSKILAHGWFEHTSNHPKTFSGVVDNFVRIFNELRKKPLTENCKRLLEK